VDVAVEERAVIGIVHDLPDGRAGAFRHHAVDHAFALVIQVPGKPIAAASPPRFLSARIVHGVFCIKKQRNRVSSISISRYHLVNNKNRELSRPVSAHGKIAFILLCHKDPDAIIRQAERLTATGDYMAIHFDARAPAEPTRGSARR
jgi:hypothetical protein